jgi:hypothetical protein
MTNNIKRVSEFVEVPASKQSISQRRLFCGVGINDADYIVNPTVNGNRLYCLFYQRWKVMLQRCYYENQKFERPTYTGCHVSKEWLRFSSFKSWMVEQDWEGKELDKDILVQGNKVYGPETCFFVTSQINALLTDSKAKRGKWPIGVNFDAKTGKFRSRCRNGKGVQKTIGLYTTPKEAYEAYKTLKYKHIAEVAATQKEPLRSALLAYKIEGDI